MLQFRMIPDSLFAFLHLTILAKNPDMLRGLLRVDVDTRKEVITAITITLSSIVVLNKVYIGFYFIFIISRTPSEMASLAMELNASEQEASLVAHSVLL